jgi:hypothetical protein
MDQVYEATNLKVTIRDDEQCFITVANKVYGMTLRQTERLPNPKQTIPVHVIDLDKPLSIVPEPVIEFTFTSSDISSLMSPGDLVVLTYKAPCCVGFIGSVDPARHTATVLPIAVNMSRGAIVFVYDLPPEGDIDSLYITKPDNTAHAYWDQAWHTIGTDVTEFQKALNIHANNQAIHITPEERRKWSSGGNFLGVFDGYGDFTNAPTYQTAEIGDFVILRHNAENDNIAIYTVTGLISGKPQWYRAHLWDNVGGKYLGAYKYYNLLPSTANRGDFALVENDFYVMAAKWELSHALEVRDFVAQPIRADETDDSIIKVHQIVDTLDSHSRSTPLSANMGRELSERSMPANSYEHLFNFGFNRTTTEVTQELFTADNVGPTNLMVYTYNGVLPKWASINWRIKDDVALFHRSGSVYLRVEAKTADTATFIYGDYLVDTDINMLGILWIYCQSMYTPPFLLLPGMRIRAGLLDPHEGGWPLSKESDTGEHKLSGSIRLYLHNA